MEFKEVGIIMGTKKPLRGIPIQIQIGTPISVEFDILSWFRIHQRWPQDWVVVHSHYGDTKPSNLDKDLHKALSLMMYPYVVYFSIVSYNEERLLIESLTKSIHIDLPHHIHGREISSEGMKLCQELSFQE